MATLSVGPGQRYATIDAAVDASGAGDTIAVQAGTYTNDWLNITHDLTLTAVGGMVVMNSANGAQPPDGKAMITESGTVSITGFDISGVTVPDNNGAAIRYQGGDLTLVDCYIHGNQDGLLGAPDPNGTITINHSEFAFNGDGSGSTHDIYVGDIASFTLTNSYIHDAIVGHEIKSRAANNTITDNRIFDNNGSASYSIDLPNGGAATITGNQIEQGPFTQNPAIFAWGEEGITHPGMAFITGNLIINDNPGGYGVLAASPVPFTDNQLWNLANLGDVTASGNTDLAARPTLDTSSLVFGTIPPPPVPPPVHGHKGYGGGNGHGHIPRAIDGPWLIKAGPCQE
jgi:hypothetical protein